MHREAVRSTKDIGRLSWLYEGLFDADAAIVLQIPRKAGQAKCQFGIIFDAISSGHPWYLAGQILTGISPLVPLRESLAGSLVRRARQRCRVACEAPFDQHLGNEHDFGVLSTWFNWLEELITL